MLNHLLCLIHKPLNIILESAYVVGSFPAIEIVLISSLHPAMLSLLQELQHLVKACTHPSFITHIHSYFTLWLYCKRK